MKSRYDRHDRDICEVIAAVKKLTDLTRKGFKTMASKSAELNAAIDALTTIVTEGMAEIDKQMAIIADGGTSEADVDAAIQRVNNVTGTIQAGVDKLKSDNV